MIFAFEHKQPSFAEPFDGWVADNATVIGDVYLGFEASIWFGAVLRGDNGLIHIGEQSNVQENAVIHTDAGLEVRIGDRVTVGHLAMLHGCAIGDESLIGIGAVTADIPILDVVSLALNEPATYAAQLNAHHAEISAFGGMFLLLVFLHFFMDSEKTTHWFGWIEKPLAKLGNPALHHGFSRSRLPRITGQEL